MTSRELGIFDGLFFQDISQEERARRIALLYKPYHEAISSNLSALRTHMAINAPPVLVFSIHSFTDLYEGKKRTLEVGVLFRDEQDRELAEIMCRTLSASGFRAALNEPWSGDRFMHSANFHARKLGVPGMDEGREARALMIEARQDLLAGDAEWRARLVQGICRSLEEWYHSFI